MVTVEAVMQNDPLARIKLSILRLLIQEPVVLTVLFINTVVFVLLAEYPRLPERVGYWVTWVDFACVVYFVVEASLKIWAMGWQGYIRNNWNKFDFIIILASLPVLIQPFLPDPSHWMAAATVFRVARVLRVLRVIRYTNSLPVLMRLQWPIYTLIALVSYKTLILDAPDWSLYLSANALAWSRRGFEFGIIFVLFWLVARVYSVIDVVYFTPLSKGDNPRMDGLLLAFLRIAVNVMCLLLGVTMGLENAGHDSTTILAGIGLGGMAIAFAAQDAVANVISGLILFLQRPFRIGDKIRIAGITGSVQAIGLRAITVRRSTGEMVFIPNRQIVGSPLTNADVRPNDRVILNLQLDHQTTAEKVQKVVDTLQDIAAANRHCEFPLSSFKDIKGGSYEVELTYYIKKWKSAERATFVVDKVKEAKVMTEVNMAVLRWLEAEEIKLAQPTLVMPQR